MKKTQFELLAFLGFVLVFPFFLPRRPRVARRAIIRGTPESIFPLINEPRNWPRWTAWNCCCSCSEIDYNYSGAQSGTGAVQKWRGRRVESTAQITQSVPNERIAFAVETTHGKYHIEGVFALESISPQHTRVTWAARWNSSRNPYARYAELFLRWWIGRSFSAGLANLRGLVEDSAASAGGQHSQQPLA